LCGSGIRWHGVALARARATLQAVAADVEAAPGLCEQVFVGDGQIALDHDQNAVLTRHREVRAMS